MTVRPDECFPVGFKDYFSHKFRRKLYLVFIPIVFIGGHKLAPNTLRECEAYPTEYILVGIIPAVPVTSSHKVHLNHYSSISHIFLFVKCSET